jgi:hypothetical protein
MKLAMLVTICFSGTYSKVCRGKHLSNTFLIQNGQKQGDALAPLLFNFRICHWDGSGKPGGTEIKWDISAASLC